MVEFDGRISSFPTLHMMFRMSSGDLGNKPASNSSVQAELPTDFNFKSPKRTYDESFLFCKIRT